MHLRMSLLQSIEHQTYLVHCCLRLQSSPWQQSYDAAIRVTAAWQASLEAERLQLQARLKAALQLHMVPRMQLDTSSPIDRTVTL